MWCGNQDEAQNMRRSLDEVTLMAKAKVPWIRTKQNALLLPVPSSKPHLVQLLSFFHLLLLPFWSGPCNSQLPIGL